MKKTLAIVFAAFCCITANAQEINAVFTRPSDGSQNHYQITSNPNVVLGNDNTITLKLGDTQGEQYTLSESNSFAVLFGSVINENENTENLEVSHPIVITSGGKLTVSGTMSNTNANDLVIENGGQLDFGEGTVRAMVEKNITGYGEGDGNWYLVASPVTSTTAPTGMIDETAANYDLYSFNQSSEDGLEWNNYKVQPFGIGEQNGYLYAHKDGTTLTFNGQLIATPEAKPLVYDGNAQFAGFNLVGNPYTCEAIIGRLFFRMNDDGDEIILEESNTNIAPCEGVFVKAQDGSESVNFSKATSRGDQQREMLSMTLSQGSNTIDRAIIQFDKGETLDKFMLDASNTKLYIPQNDKEFAAVVTRASTGEMPVNFKASKDGKYTISVNTANVEAEYLHLVDNLTGNDVDLLGDGTGKDVPWRISTQEPTYTFDAKTSDYAARFKLVFGMKDTEPAEVSDTFAFISNGEIIISNEGRATLQVIDAMGRIIRNQQIEGEARISTQGLTAGVYVLCLNGMTQKIVVR